MEFHKRLIDRSAHRKIQLGQDETFTVKKSDSVVCTDFFYLRPTNYFIWNMIPIGWPQKTAIFSKKFTQVCTWAVFHSGINAITLTTAVLQFPTWDHCDLLCDTENAYLNSSFPGRKRIKEARGVLMRIPVSSDTSYSI